MLAKRCVVPVVLACGGAMLSACGASKAYVPLTSANIGATMAAAIKNLHTAHEVSTGSGATATIDFDNSGAFRYRMTQSSTAGATTRAETLIGIGSNRYLQYPGVTPAGKWIKVPSSSNTAAITFPDINPVEMVARFSKGIKTFAYLGATTIAGAHVQHYKVVIDQQKYLRATGQGLGSANLGSAETLTEDLYLNDDNTVRRVVLALPGGVGNTQVDVTNWGKPVTIEVPPASAVVTSVPHPSKK